MQRAAFCFRRGSGLRARSSSRNERFSTRSPSSPKPIAPRIRRMGFKQDLRAGHPLLGTFLKTPHPHVVECLPAVVSTVSASMPNTRRSIARPSTCASWRPGPAGCQHSCVPPVAAATNCSMPLMRRRRRARAAYPLRRRGIGPCPPRTLRSRWQRAGTPTAPPACSRPARATWQNGAPKGVSLFLLASDHAFLRSGAQGLRVAAGLQN